jgi:hypothetical protein
MMEEWKKQETKQNKKHPRKHESTKARKKRGGRETWPAFLEFVWKG